MGKNRLPGRGSGAPELVFSRAFNAPADAVYRAWTDPARLVQWWGPHGFRLTIQEMDVRVGGTWRYVLHGPDGTQYPNVAVFEELDPPRRLVFFNTGGHVEDKHLTCRMIATFAEDGARTLVTLQMQFETVEALDRAKARGAKAGGEESFQRLAELLEDSQHSR